MPDNYYPESGDEAAPSQPAGEDGAIPKSEEKPDENNEQTALIPKGLLAGKDFEPGEEVVFKIVKMHGDEVEIAYATGEESGEDKGEGEGEDSEMAKADKKLSMMAQ